MSGGLVQPQHSGGGQTASFLFKILISVLTIVISAGVLAMFNMNVLIVRLDERFISVDRRMVIIEQEHRQFRNGTSSGILGGFQKR